MAKKKSVATPAIAALDTAGREYVVHAFDHDPRTELSFGDEAVQALGVAGDRIFKTLMAEVDGSLTVAVVPVNAHLDLKALAQACQAKKAVMAQVSAAERATGYVAGGISPLGQRSAHRTVVDLSSLTHGTVFISGGKRGLDIELDPRDLIELTGAITAEIARS